MPQQFKVPEQLANAFKAVGIEVGVYPLKEADVTVVRSYSHSPELSAEDQQTVENLYAKKANAIDGEHARLVAEDSDDDEEELENGATVYGVSYILFDADKKAVGKINVYYQENLEAPHEMTIDQLDIDYSLRQRMSGLNEYMGHVGIGTLLISTSADPTSYRNFAASSLC